MIDTKTFYAVAEIAQAAAHLSGFVGPVEFTICRPRNYDWCGVEDDPVSTESDSDRASFARVTEDEDYWDDDDGWCGDCGNCEDCWDEQMQDCGLMPDGLCSQAGSEYCDWDCRMREILEEI